jgi:hypothetical protein
MEGRMRNRILALAVGGIVVALIGIAVWVGLSRSSANVNVRVEGTIAAIKKDTVTVRTDSGESVVVLITNETMRAGPLGSAPTSLKIADLAVGGQFIVLEGARMDDGTVRAIRVVAH